MSAFLAACAGQAHAGRAFGPAVLERWEKVLPQADVVRLEDAGHFVPEDAPNELANLLVDFLGRRSLSREARPSVRGFGDSTA